VSRGTKCSQFEAVNPADDTEETTPYNGAEESI
jgi:hypothetical protein